MQQYDVIIVGAGPAGSTTARECAARGRSVLLLEKEAFPRDKPCGGGVNVRAAALLPFDLSPVVERTVSTVSFSVRQAAHFTRTSARPLTYMTQRARLDHYLVERAVEAGAILRERSPLEAVEQAASGMLVRAGGVTYQARVLVAADGANGPTLRAAGLPERFAMGVALEGNIGALTDGHDAMRLDLGDVPHGYGWLFPKGDHVNIGVAGFGPVVPMLRERLFQLTRFYGYDPQRFWGLRGFRLPMRTADTPLVGGNVIAVGDAAGLLDPVTGEGIYAAIFSGRAAARHIVTFLSGRAADLSGYEEEIRRELLPDLDIARRWRDVAHLSPALFARLIERSPRAWGLVCRILRGEETYVEFTRRRRSIARIVNALLWMTRAGARRERRPVRRQSSWSAG
ncbi:MAG TPA: NAD(P)/FAD-dependent oxidoreductase [bacterium]|nr:NAD(P)/FAD-dependent oxidoreductase [bacterium]